MTEVKMLTAITVQKLKSDRIYIHIAKKDLSKLKGSTYRTVPPTTQSV